MSYSIQGDLRENTVPAGPRQKGVPVEDLVAKVADLYEGQIFNRATEKGRFELEGVIPLRLREGFKGDLSQKHPESVKGDPPRFFGVHEIFERCVYGKKDRVQLLIEGPGGSGKSTILRQLAALWQKAQSGSELLTEGEEKIRAGFKRYKLIVRIPLDKLGGECLIHWREYLFEQLDFDDRADFKCTLKSLCKKREVLFLLDDYNTAVQNKINFQATGINKVLQTQHWMMTSRLHSYDGENYSKLEQVEIAGFSVEGVEAYIQRYFSEPKEAKSLIQLISQSPNLAEIAKIPLLLEILCFNWLKNKKSAFDKATTTSLFQLLVLTLLKGYLTRLGKEVRFATFLDELLSDRRVANQDLKTAVSIFVDVMEQVAFSHLMGHKEKYSFRKDDPILINLVKAVIQKANVPGVEDNLAGPLLDILFADVGLLKVVQGEEGEFLHGNLQEYFAGRHLARCIQGNFEVSPGQSWQNWVGENKFDRNLAGIFRFAAGELDLKRDVKGLSVLLSQIRSEEPKSIFGTPENVLSARCLEEVRNSELPAQREVIQSLQGRLFLRDPHAMLYLLDSSLILGNIVYETALCGLYDQNWPIEDFIKGILPRYRTISTALVKHIFTCLQNELLLFLKSRLTINLNQKNVIKYIRDLGFLGVQDDAIIKLLVLILREDVFPESVRKQAARTIKSMQTTTQEVQELLQVSWKSLGLDKEEGSEGARECEVNTIQAADPIICSTYSGLHEGSFLQYLSSGQDILHNSTIQTIKAATMEFSENFFNALVDCLLAQSNHVIKENLIKFLGEVEPPRVRISAALTRCLQDSSMKIQLRAIGGLLRHYEVGREVAQAILSILQTGRNSKLIKILRKHVAKLDKVTPILLELREESQEGSIAEFLELFPIKNVLNWCFVGKVREGDFVNFLAWKSSKATPLICLTEKFLYVEENGVLEKYSLEAHENLYSDVKTSLIGALAAAGCAVM